MAQTTRFNEYGTVRIVHVIFILLLIISFFLPWVNWDGHTVAGHAMPLGEFFETSSRAGGPADPFPQFRFGLYIFWLVPVLGLLALLFVYRKKPLPILSFFAGALSLSLITVYILFTRTLVDLGVSKSLMETLQPGLYLQVVAAAGMILTAFPVKSLVIKIVWLLAGPVAAVGGYNIGEHYLMNEVHDATENVKADYTVNAIDLLKEFVNNDTLTNKKYLDKTLLVSGTASQVSVLPDSTSTIKFEDSTGSYAIFSLEKDEVESVKKLKVGETVTVKGVCSGSIFSEILGTTSVTFKRATLK